MANPISDLVKNLSDKYKTGDKETTGLGDELHARAQMNEAALGKPAASVDTKPRTPAAWERVNRVNRAPIKGEKRISPKDISDWTKPLPATPVYDKGGRVVVAPKVAPKAAPKAPVRQAPITMKVDTGKPSSFLPLLIPEIKPTPVAPLYDKGGKVNVNDGKHQLAILKDGERVLTEKQNEKYEKSNPAENATEMKIYDKGGKVASPYDMITGGKTPKKEVKEMVHSKTHNGKHVVTHRHHSPMHHPDETHMFNNMDEVKDHMDAHAGAEPAEGAAPLTAAPSPAPAAPAAGPAMPGM